jgi:hypothetical protein
LEACSQQNVPYSLSLRYLSSLHHARHIRRRAQETLAAKAENQHTFIYSALAPTQKQSSFLFARQKKYLLLLRGSVIKANNSQLAGADL